MLLVNYDNKHQNVLNELDLGEIDLDKQFLVRHIIEWMKETGQTTRYSSLEMCKSYIAQFYELPSLDVIALLDREAVVNGVQDQLTWDGSGDVEAWAIANGYGDEIARATRVLS